MNDYEILLQIKQVSKSFDRPQRFWAVKEVSLTLHRGESLGLVGESGCGKSTLAKMILRLFPRIDSGCIESGFHAYKNIYEFDSSSVEMRDYRKRVQMIFQNPDVALNPGMTIGQIIKEAVKMGGNQTKGRWNPLKKRTEISEQMQKYMELMNLNDRTQDYPATLSGGEKKRVGIIRAFAVKPELIIADEPLVGLDISLRNQLINLFLEQKKAENLTFFYISHDITVIKQLCSAIAVMYLGRIIEQGTTQEVMSKPKHPYTVSLLKGSLPHLGWGVGQVEQGCCPFRSRCFLYLDRLNALDKSQCERKPIVLKPITCSNQKTACHFWDKLS